MTPYIDLHCDTLFYAANNRIDDIYCVDGAMADLKRLKEAKVRAQFFAVFFPQEIKNFKGDMDYFEKARSILFHTIKAHPQDVSFVEEIGQFKENERQKKLSAFLSVEDGRCVDGDMKKLYFLHEQGVRLITLTWNFPNCFGFPNAKDKSVMQKGLTEFGVEAVREMNRLGIVVDVSHLSDGGFYDVARYSKVPFVASHSNCRSLTPHPRNLTDDMIRIIAEKGGVAGLNLAPAFVCEQGKEKKSTAKRLAEHAKHMLQVGGEELPAIGTDFDGTEGNMEIKSPGGMELLFEELKRSGFTERQIGKIASGNVERVLESCMG